MFITLLVVTFVIAALTCACVAALFDRPATTLLDRIFVDDLAPAWRRYLKFAMFVVGISGGVRIWELEKYISPHSAQGDPLVLNLDRWVLEVYRTHIGTLQSTALLLLAFFAVFLVAYGLTRLAEPKPKAAPQGG